MSILLFKKRENIVEGGDVLVGEREEYKKNLSMVASIAGKTGAPVNSIRIAASTNNNSTNANIASDAGGIAAASGPDHSHVANTIIAPPASKKEPATYKSFEKVHKVLGWAKKTMSRGPSGGRLR